MPKRDPRSTPPPPALVRGDTFYEPRPDGPIAYPIRFRAQLDGAKELKMAQDTAAWIRDYVTGRPLPTQPPAPAPTVTGPPARLPPVGEGAARKEIVVTEELCRTVAGLVMMEFPEEGDAPYSFEDWAALSVTSPTAFSSACQFALRLAEEARDAEKNWPSPDTA